MKYTADLHSAISKKRLCRVKFDCADPTLAGQYAKSAAGRAGVRNVQYLVVRNLKSAA